MGDFFVHVRMKECCRETLTKVDQHKKKAKHTGGVKSLHAAFSEKTIDEAKGVIPAAWGWVEDELAALVRAACEKLCEQHAEHHHGKGETEEAAYWSELGAAICGKPVAKTSIPTAAGAHGKHKGRSYVVYADEVKLGGSRAWRNNNPGNIVAGKFAMSHGAIGSDGHFAVFPDEATGQAAVTSLLKGDGYKNLSIADAMAKYAPPSENDTVGYVGAVSKATGLDANRKVGDLSDEELSSFTQAIRAHEGWKAGDVLAPGTIL